MERPHIGALTIATVEVPTDSQHSLSHTYMSEHSDNASSCL